MKRILGLLTILMVVSLGVCDAQSTTKKSRKAKRNAQFEEVAAAVKKAVEAPNFAYSADRISATTRGFDSNVKMEVLTGINVTPNNIKCYLPIYGTDIYNSRPSMKKRLDFYVSKYEYETKPLKNGGWFIKIRCIDDRTATTYMFDLNITPNGKMSTMTVMTQFDSPIIYVGDFKPM